MRNKILLAASLSVVMLSCEKERNAADSTSNDTTMNETAVVEKKSLRVKGPSGMLYVEESGAGGIPVVFTHSFGGSTTQWDNQQSHLKDERRVIAFDFRDHGKSEPPSDKKFTPEAMAMDISAVVDSLQLDRFVLVGHSMGGSASVAYAQAHPDRVAGLVLAGTPGKTPSEISKPVITSLESPSYQKVMDEYMKGLLANARPDVDSSVSHDFRQISKESSLAIIKSMFQYDPLPALKQYKGPVLIISSSREDKQPNTLAAQMPGANHKTIEGTSHWTQMDKPDEFNRLLDDFLKSIR
jgi:pimeloyl-ACP methyl ester carboxylesterase